MSESFGIYPERESKTLEFKEFLPKFSSLIKTCVAFANTAGGQIIIGVEDGTRKIVGVTDEQRERLYEDFPSSLYDSTNNGMFAHIYERNFNSHSVLIIEIPLSTKRPSFIKQEGIPKGVYLRVGASTRRAKQPHVEELMRESRHEYYDLEPTRAALDDLSIERLSQCYGESYSLKKLESDGVITRLNVFANQHAVTLAGVLMFADNPEHYIPEALILCTEFAGTEGRNIIQTRDITGPLAQVVHESMSLLEHWLEKNFKLKGAKLIGSTPIPPLALREAIINGLIHRKYSIPGALKIALYDDRLEVFSPGALPGLVDINNLGDGTTYLRNPHVAKLARRLKLLEKLGTGIKLIFEECKKLGIERPEYHEDGDFVKVVFNFRPDIDATHSDEEIIMRYITMHKEVTISEISDLLQVSRNTVTRKLNQLIAKGVIVRTGRGPAVKYLLCMDEGK